jgi:hypothetical protein
MRCVINSRFCLFMKHLTKPFFVSLISTAALASQALNYGLGGMTSGRVNAVTAEPESAYSALYNPSLIAAAKRPLFAFGTSVAHTKYEPLRNVLLRSPVTGDLRPQDYELPGSTMTLWSVGFSYPFLFPALQRALGIGIALSGPFNKLRSFSSQGPDDFYSLRYGSSDSQFKASLSGSVEIIPEHLYFGAGVSFFISGAGNADTTLATDDPQGKMSMDVGLQSAAIVGLYGRIDEETGAGLSYHQAIDPTFTQKIDATVGVGNSRFRQPVLVRSSLYYEPHSFDLDAQKSFSFVKISLGLSYQLWREYRAPILITETTDSEGRRHVTQTPASNFENTFSPRVSAEVPLLEDTLFFAGGYQYRPSPVKDLSGISNVLDSNSHVVGLSFEHLLLPGEIIPIPLRWGISGQYHWLEARQVSKAGATVGAPGYEFKGNTYTYGVFLQAEL